MDRQFDASPTSQVHDRCIDEAINGLSDSPHTGVTTAISPVVGTQALRRRFVAGSRSQLKFDLPLG